VLVKERGAVASIIIFILLVVISSMVMNLSAISTASVSDSSQYKYKTQSLFLAETALEKAVYRLNSGSTCSAIVEGSGTDYFNGQFQILSATEDLPTTGDCQLVLKGEYNKVITLLKVELENIGGGGVGPTSITEQFPDASDFASNWSAVLTNTDGSSVFSSYNCPSAVCPTTLAGSGSHLAATNPAKNNASYSGYLEKTISQIDTGASGLTGDFFVAFEKQVASGTAIKFVTEVQLYDTTNSRNYVLWSNGDKVTVPFSSFSSPISLPSNRLFDRLQMTFDFRQRKKLQLQAYFDEIIINVNGGGGSADNWQILSWQEVDTI